MTHITYSDEYKSEKKASLDSTKSITPSLKTPRRKKQENTSFMWWEEPYNHARGESALWVAVITQAMMDALSRSKNPEAIYHKNEAIRWLTDNGKDFKQVCLLADRDPDTVRCKAKRALISPITWRAAPGKGKRYQERKAYRQRLKKKNSLSPKAPPVLPMGDNVIRGPW